MTTKQKAKAYDEAWHKAKRIINVCVDDNTECRSMIACIQQIFPELAESEDEKIRKWLIGYFQRNKVAEVIKTHDILAWLEKQGEQKLPIEKLSSEMKTIGESLGFTTQEEYDRYNQMVTDLIMSDDGKSEQKPTDEEIKTLLRTEYEKGRADAIAEIQNPVDCIDCTNSKGCINCKNGNMKETLVQKTAWSEADEKIGKDLIDFCIKCSQGDTVVNSQDDFAKWVTWLKSLKDRVQPRRRHTIFDEII